MPYQNTTLGTLKLRLAEKYEGQPFWTADHARRAINEGLRIWSLITGTGRTSIDLNQIPFDPYLAVSGTLLKSTRVRIQGRELALTSLYGLDHAIGNWEGVNTRTGGAVPAKTTHWAPVGLTMIATYPAYGPQAGLNPDVQKVAPITVEGVRSTTILVNDGDFLDLGDEEINTLLGYALHVLSFAKGIEALKKTQPLRIAFFKAAARRSAVFAASSLYRKILGYDRTRSAVPIEAPPTAQEAAAVAAVEGK